MHKFIRKILVLLLCSFVALDPFLLAGALAQEVSPNPESVMITGPVTAVTETESSVNTTLIDSNLESVVIPVLEESDQSITPFTLVSPSPSILSSPVSTDSATVIPAATNLEIENKAIVESQSVATALTGDNTQVVTGDTTMITGESTALATNLSLTNTTLVNSDLQVGVMVVLKEWGGDLVLDPIRDQIDNFRPSTMTIADVEINNGETNVTATTTVKASTGDNTQIASESSELVTGEAMAVAQNNLIVNTSVINSDVFQFFPENIWLWSGRILNWEYPGSSSAASALSNLASVPQNTSCSGSCNMNIKVSNSADVTTETTAIASTGDNYQETSDNASMITGNAKAIAASTTMVNTTLVDSRYRLLSMLLLAPWVGNLVFAYPDIQLVVKAPEKVFEGEQIPYEIVIKNIGYGKALNLNLEYKIEQDSAIVLEKSEKIEYLKYGESLTRNFEFPTDGRAGAKILFSANTSNSVSEESLSNNSAITQTEVMARSKENTGNSSFNEVPRLRLISKNNINGYIYPGDGATYDMSVFNDGPINAKNIFLIQRLYSPTGELISEFGGKVGDLELNKGKNVRFVLNTPSSLPSGEYYTQSYVSGQSDQGTTTYSNTVQDIIVLRARAYTISSTTPATSLSATENEEQVLGVTTNLGNCAQCTSFPWYVAITLGSLAYYLICARRRDYLDAIKWGLALPLTAYAGLIYSNASCAQGIVMLSSSGSSCIWFLPVAFGVYGLVMTSGRLIHNFIVNTTDDFRYLEKI